MLETVDLLDKAYLGKRVHDLLTTLTNQLGTVYRTRGIDVPVIASSTLHILNNSESASVADIARKLDITHQLASQRIDKLLKRRLVEKRPDLTDARKVLWALTSEGRKQSERLSACMLDSIEVHEKLFADIGINLMSALDDAQVALNAAPLSRRFAEVADIKVAS